MGRGWRDSEHRGLRSNLTWASFIPLNFLQRLPRGRPLVGTEEMQPTRERLIPTEFIFQ